MSRVRVLHLISTPGPHPWFDTLAEHADRARFDICVGCVAPAGPLQEAMANAAIPSFALDAPRRSDLAIAIGRLARLLRRRRIDVIQTHLPEACLVGLVAARVAGTSARIFTAHHSSEVPLQGNRKLLVVDKLCAGLLSDCVVAPSRRMKEVMIESESIAPHRIEVIEHGFDLDRLDPASVSRDDARRALGVDGGVVVGAVGRSHWIKNYETLIRAFAAVADYDPSTVLVIAGPGHEGSARLADRLGVGDRVRVLGARSDVPALLSAFDLFAHPALTESFGMVVVEAMAMGRPVISGPVGIAADLIQTGRTGVRVDGDDVPAWAVGLRTALALRPHWADMGATARASVSGFRADRMVRRYEELYLGVLTRRRRG